MIASDLHIIKYSGSDTLEQLSKWLSLISFDEVIVNQKDKYEIKDDKSALEGIYKEIVNSGGGIRFISNQEHSDHFY